MVFTLSTGAVKAVSAVTIARAGLALGEAVPGSKLAWGGLQAYIMVAPRGSGEERPSAQGGRRDRRPFIESNDRRRPESARAPRYYRT